MSDTALRPWCSTHRAGYTFSSDTKTGKAVVKYGYNSFPKQGNLTANPILLFFNFSLWFLSCQNHTRRLRGYKGSKEPLSDMSPYIMPSQTSVFKPNVVAYQYFPAVIDSIQWKNCSLLFGQIKFTKEKGENKVAITILLFPLLSMKYSQVNCYELSSTGWKNMAFYIFHSLLLLARCLNMVVLEFSS